MKNCFIVFLILISFNVRVLSQGSYPAFNMETLTTKDGLSNNIVFDILQDSKGYMWFATLNGLVRYDGSRMTEYGGNNSMNGLDGTIIECMYEDNKKNLWIGSRLYGISTLNRLTNSWYNHHKALGKLQVTSLCQDQQGNILFSERNAGLIIRIKEVGNSNYSYDTLLNQSLQINKVFIDALGRTVLLHEFKLWLIKNRKLEKYPCGSSLSTHITSLDADKKGNIVFYDGGGVYYYDVIKNKTRLLHNKRDEGKLLVSVTEDQKIMVANQHTLYIYSSVLTLLESFFINNRHAPAFDANFNKLYQGRDGVIWIGTDNGIIKISKQKLPFTIFNTQKKQSDNYIRALFYDQDNSLWVGHKMNSVNKISFSSDFSKFVNISLKIPSDIDRRTTFNTFLQLKNGDILAGGLEGIFLIKKNTSIAKRYHPKILKRYLEVWSLFEDEVGRIWFGVNRKGLYIFNPSTGSLMTYRNKNDTLTSSIWTIYPDSKGKVWVGTSFGLWYTEKPSSQHPVFTRLLKGSNHVFLHGKHIWQLLEDNDKIWIGTTDAGLSYLDKNGNIYDAKRLGFNYNQVSGLLLDNKKNLWVSTMNGIYSIEKKGAIKHFTEDDGLPSNDFSFKACTSSENGYLFFGTKSGISYFHPDSILSKASVTQKVHISSLNVLNKSEYTDPDSHQIDLSYKDNFFTINYFLPDYHHIYKNIYRYKLEGLDEKWRYTDYRSPTAYYTNVPSGKYTFIVQAANSENNWSNEYAQLSLYINPPYWKTWWFLLTIIAFTSSTVFLLLRYRLKQLVIRRTEKHKLNKTIAELELKALQAQMNPHFIFNAINAIQHFIINKNVRDANNYLSKFAQLMRLYLESSKNKFIPLSQEILLLTLYLELEKLRFSDKMDYSIQIDSNLDVDSVDIPSMLLQPFIENSINHGITALKDRKGFIEIIMSQQNDKLLIIIEDNGIGIKKSEEQQTNYIHTHKSRGMQIVNERISTLQQSENRKIEIKIIDKQTDNDIRNSASSGTRIEIVITLN